MQLRQFLKFQKEKDIPYELRCRLCCQLNYNSQICNQCDAVYCDYCQGEMTKKNKKCLKCRQELQYKQITGFQKEVLGSILCACEFCGKDIYSEKFAKHKQKCLKRHYEFLIHTRKRLYIIPKELKEHQQRFLCGKCKLLVIHPLKCKHCDQLYCEVCANQLYDENKQLDVFVMKLEQFRLCEQESLIIKELLKFNFNVLTQTVKMLSLLITRQNLTFINAQMQLLIVLGHASGQVPEGITQLETRVVKRKAERYQKDVEELNDTLRKCQLKKEKLQKKSQKLIYAYKNLDQRWFLEENQQNVNQEVNQVDKDRGDDLEIKKIQDATPEESKQDNEPRDEIKQTETKPITIEIQDD